MPQYFDSTAAFPMKTKKRVYASGGRTGLWHGGTHNTGRMNLLEEQGRIRAEPQTRNVRAEEARVRGELNRGYKGGKRVSKAEGGRTKKQFGGGFTRPLGGVGGVGGVDVPIRPAGYKGGGAAVRGLGRAFTNAKKV